MTTRLPRPSRSPRIRLALSLSAAALLIGPALVGVAAAADRPSALAPAKPQPLPQPRLEDFIAQPGDTLRFQPSMLHADLVLDLDRRAKLDSIVFVLENGARCAQVMDHDSTWAVDYTWVYPHSLLPPRWYDARSLIGTGDSLKLADNADIKLTFGTLRIGVHAGSLKQATAEAYRLWPAEMPVALRGRLKLKVERAKKALAGEKDTEPLQPTGH